MTTRRPYIELKPETQDYNLESKPISLIIEEAEAEQKQLDIQARTFAPSGVKRASQKKPTDNSSSHYRRPMGST